MTEFQAAIGIPQFKELDKILQKRIIIAKKYDAALKNEKLIKIPTRFKNRRHTYQTYHILLDKKINRDKLIVELKNEHIETNLGAQALPCLTYYKNKYGFDETDFPNATEAYNQGLALPLHCKLTESQIKFIIEKLKEIINDQNRTA
jgi:dTDP-4-amino-4,6-dideoxygalactose transaminase